MTLNHMAAPAESLALAMALDDAGADEVWVPETWGFDAPSLMGAIAVNTRRICIGAVLPVFTRSPPTTAASAGEVARLNGISLTDSTALAERQRELEQLLMTLMTLFEPYPFARQQRVSAARDLHSSSWRAACTPLLQQVMRNGW